MRVSIVTVVYNNRDLVQDAIDSVAAQDYGDMEHILIDGGSTDGTMNIVKSYRHLKWISEMDDGLYDAMNKGVMMASGDIIGLLNSDDLFKDQYVVSRVVDFFKNSTNVDIVFGNLEYVKRENPKDIVRVWRTGDFYPSFFEDGLVPPHPAVYLKRKVYDKHLFDLDFKLAADYEFMLRIFKDPEFKVGYLDSICVSMRLGGVTNNSLRNIINGNIEIKNAWHKNGFSLPHFFWMKRIIFKLKQFLK
ncbi:glycosyltransferase family 2 protein [Cyclobacterium xiamenense]|uniref:glycosyltransferase family 2 protein n=1 Tax=Cyclobacterium xiamenense TaxID=1297121 RepID=UPI0035D089D0